MVQLIVSQIMFLSFLANTEELDRFASDVTNRERRTAAGIAVHFGQHYAGRYR